MSGRNGANTKHKSSFENARGTDPTKEHMATRSQTNERPTSESAFNNKGPTENNAPSPSSIAYRQDEEAQKRAQENDSSERGRDTGPARMETGDANGPLKGDGRPDLHGYQNYPNPPQGRTSEGRSAHDVNCMEHNQPKLATAGHAGDQWESFGEEHRPQTQKKAVMQMQMQRAAEASKQMLYGVYGNFVSILEEYEARTHETKAARSNIALPDQSRKTVEDVQSIVQTQLLLFETQQRACPKEVSQSVNKELRKKALHWAAVRQEKNMPINETDKYICQLEIVTAETIRENVQHIFKGKHDAMEIDQEFKNDEKKKASSPETRRSELDDAYKIGVLRMGAARPELAEILTDDLAEFSKEGIEGDLK